MSDFLTFLTLARIGLILNVAGALFLIFGSDKVVHVVSKFVDIITPTYGTYGQGRAIPEIKKLALEFEKAKKTAKRLNTIGYLLFTIGFILQLF